MRIVTFLLMLFVCVFNVTSADATHYPSARIARYATNTPRSVENNLNTLTKHLISPLDDDYDKAKVIAFWIASHINYDKYLYNNGNVTKLMKTYMLQSPDELLESRVGICSEFAMLFDRMSKIAGIRSKIVNGYAYPVKLRLRNKEKRNYAHAWNYFLYNNKKIYVDTTFMAGGTTSPTRRVTDISHKRALRKVERSNKYESQVNNFNEYYFDFNYRDELGKMNYKHEEK